MGRLVFSSIVVLLFLYVIYPFIIPVVMGGILAVLVQPLAIWLKKRKLSPALTAALLTLLMAVVVVLPTAFLIFFAAETGVDQFRLLPSWARHAEGGTQFYDRIIHLGFIENAIKWISIWVPIQSTQLMEASRSILISIGARLANAFGGFLSSIPSITLATIVSVVSMFFFLVDYERIVIFIRKNSFFNKVQTESIIRSFGSMCRSVILATVVSGAAQAIVFSLACLFTGTSNVALIGLSVFICSFLPLVGSTPATFSVVIYMFANGNSIESLILVIVATLVTIIDNLIRPMVLKGAGDLHPLLAFIAAFGGLKTLGVAGMFIGPIIAGLFVVTFKILIEQDLKKELKTNYNLDQS
jgi:predicted PurR-regulated permease PerM